MINKGMSNFQLISHTFSEIPHIAFLSKLMVALGISPVLFVQSRNSF